MGHRFELSKRHERKIKFELNSRCVRISFSYTRLCAPIFDCVSRGGLWLSSAAAKEINDEPSLNNSRQPRRPLASPRINLNFLVMVSLPFRIC